jgi:polyhydroxyalkanoate synthesis repressor PhaR
MTAARLITKYPNRRLYDNGESRYVTLLDVRRLVREKTDFSVIDKKSGKDITRSILLQVITELEQHGDAIMSRDFLAQIIRSYDNVVPGIASDYLEQSMKFFMTQQQNLRNRIQRVVGADPFATVADLANKNIARWKALQDEVLKRFSASLRSDAADFGADTDSPSRPPGSRGRAASP